MNDELVLADASGHLGKHVGVRVVDDEVEPVGNPGAVARLIERRLSQQGSERRPILGAEDDRDGMIVGRVRHGVHEGQVGGDFPMRVERQLETVLVLAIPEGLGDRFQRRLRIVAAGPAVPDAESLRVVGGILIVPPVLDVRFDPPVKVGRFGDVDGPALVEVLKAEQSGEISIEFNPVWLGRTFSEFECGRHD